MARNGSGTMSVPYPDFVNGTTADADQVDANNADIVAEITNSIAADGQTTPTANLPMGGYKHTGLGSGSAATDSANLGQIQAQAWKWCGTAGGTKNALTLSPSPAITAYAAGQSFRAIIGGTSSDDAVTVAISGLATKAVEIDGSACSATNFLETGKLYQFDYDGTALQATRLSSATQAYLTSSAIGVTVQAYDADTAKTDAKQSFTAQQRPLTAALTYNASQTWDCDAAQDATLTLTGNITTFGAPTNQVAGSYYALRLNVGSGPYSVTAWNAVFKFPGGTAPTLTATASAIDVLIFRSDGTNMELVGLSQDVK